MSFAEILLIAVGLAMDAFAVSLGVGAAGQAQSPRPIFRLSFHFGLFQGLMPVLGWLAGTRVAFLISGVDHWVALALLAFVGGRMIKEGLDPDGDCAPADASRGGTLVVLCVATSIDAFAVGLSMAMLNVPVLYPSAIIGVVTAGLSLLALLVGGRLGHVFGKRMEVIGGLILIGIGLRVLLSHLL
jgi:putative Mn2+ efflux pump MntP